MGITSLTHHSSTTLLSPLPLPSFCSQSLRPFQALRLRRLAITWLYLNLCRWTVLGPLTTLYTPRWEPAVMICKAQGPLSGQLLPERGERGHLFLPSTFFLSEWTHGISSPA